MLPEPWIWKVAENCIGADVLAERGDVCISKEQLDHFFVWNTQEAAFQRIVFYRHCVRNVGFHSNRVSHCELFHILSFFPIANMYFVL